MAPIKFEDNIREKLEGREIEPSSDAWKKLSERLDENSKKKNNYTIWYAVAASIIGVLIAISVFSNKDDKLNENSTDFVNVNTSEREVPNENVPKLVDNISEEKIKASLITEESNTITLNKKSNFSKEKLPPKKKDLILKSKEVEASQAVAVTIKEDQSRELSQIPKEIISSADLKTGKRIDELVAQAEIMQQSNETVSAEEINTLLANAEHKIQSEKNIDSKKIDPLTLLGDVEFEMETSFRDKVFKAFGDGYDIIKTAIVDRNN